MQQKSMLSFSSNSHLKDVETRLIAYWVLTDTVYTSTQPSQHRRLKDLDNATEIDVLLLVELPFKRRRNTSDCILGIH